jgi:hypothetical protein
MSTKHTPGPWQWVNSSTDEQFNFDAEWDGEGMPSLRTMAERKKNEDSRWELPLPDWILDAEPMQHGNDAANARLIAAAPDMKERLQSAIDALDRLTDLIDGTGFSYSDEFSSALDEIDLGRAAINKVEGKPCA